MNYLFCSVGRRCEIIKDFKKSLSPDSVIIAVDNNKYAPALYIADKFYIVDRITNENYIQELLNICRQEHIKGVLSFIDPEIEILARNRSLFEKEGIMVFVPSVETAQICFDKYKMYQYLINKGIRTIPTYNSVEDFQHNSSRVFPVFVKPRTGSGSVGAREITTLPELIDAFKKDSSLIVQQKMTGLDIDADAYIDTISNEVVSIFSKRKLETKIGGASKTISFKDSKLIKFVCSVISCFHFYGPIDMDLFYQDGAYFLSEVNPRLGGAYLHAYGCGVDFVKLMEKNLSGEANPIIFDSYEENVVMMMYDSVVIKKIEEIE